MASKKRISGLVFYNLLKKEAYAFNQSLKKPLSPTRVDNLVKKSLFPAWQGENYSRIPKKQIRSQIESTFKKATKKNKGAALYNKILSSVSRLNQDVPDTQRLNIKEQRELVSKELYPKFKAAKGRPTYKDIEKAAAASLRTLKKDVCNILAVPENTYQNILYFEIDELLDDRLPNCVFVAVDAGRFGNTDIFNTRNYNYNKDGIAEITNNINKAVRNGELPGSSSEVPYYRGIIQVRPDKKNDGNPENYYLSLILYINDQPEAPTAIVKIPRSKSKSYKKSFASTRKYANEKAKQLKGKSPVKLFRRSVTKEIKKAVDAVNTLNDSVNKQNAKLFSSAIKQYKKDFNSKQTARLDKALKSKKINERQYKEFKSAVDRAFSDKKQTRKRKKKK